MKRPLLGITFAFCLGILLEETFNVPVFFIFIPAAVFLLLSMLSLKSKRVFLSFMLTAFLALGGLAYKNFISLPPNHIRNIIGSAQSLPAAVLAQGVISNEPVKGITSYKQERADFLLSVKAIKLYDKWESTSGLLSVRVFGPDRGFRYADEVILEGEISLPRPATNPGQFDYKKFLERKKIFYTLNVKEPNFSRITARDRANLVKKTAYLAAQKLDAKIDSFISGPENAILKAILLGERRDIEDDINDDFIKTVTIHILSISGLHVALLASIFMLLFKLLRFPFGFRILILSALLLFYCVMVGGQPPALRSTIMILVFLFGRFLKKKSDILNSLAFAALTILFFNPQDLFDIGFQLSFLTVGSIVYFTPKLETLFSRSSPFTIYHLPITIYLIRLFLASVSAWLGSAPLVAKYFNIFSPITIVANMFVVPCAFFMMAASLTFILLGLFSSVLGLIFSQAAALSITVLLKTISFFAGLPFSCFMVKGPSWIVAAGFYAFLLLFFNRGRFKLRAKYFLIAGLLFLNLFIWPGVFFGRQDALKISFLDVGNGDSIFIEFPKGQTMLIDGGEGLGADMGRLVVSRFLASEGINKIDLVVATHPHTDHIGGLVAVLKNFKVRYFMDNGEKDNNPLYFQCQRLVKQKRIKRIVLKGGDTISGFQKARIQVLNPPPEKFRDANNNSLVLKLEYDDSSVMFCGDIKEEAAKKLLLKEDKILHSTVLKIPHHGGSLGSAAFYFLKKIDPKFAVISLRDREVNSSILLILKELGTILYRTDIDGAVFLKLDKNRQIFTAFKNN